MYILTFQMIEEFIISGLSVVMNLQISFQSI
nr:MAG TPA: hypothetical protein [Caudoviricetes sp.]